MNRFLRRVFGGGLGGVVCDKIQIVTEPIAVLTSRTGKKKWIYGHNIVTDAGDLFYAERGALLTTGTPVSPVPTNFTDANGVPDPIFELYSGASGAPAKGNDRSDLTTLIEAGLAVDATYPLVNDGDGDNTGAGVDIITWRRSYTTGQGNDANIADVILTNPSPGASEPVLMHAEFTPFAKTSSDTLKVFINHRMNGV